jgi:hypothetical protein
MFSAVSTANALTEASWLSIAFPPGEQFLLVTHLAPSQCEL